MRKLRNRLTDTGILLCVLLLLQSCGVYYKNTISLEEAVKQESKVKVLTSDQKTTKYKQITSTDGRFYGTKMKGGKWTQIPLNQGHIASVRLKNKKASTWVTVLGFGVPVAALIIWAATADYGIGFSWGGY